MEERTAHSIDPLTGEAIIIGFTWDITERKKTEAELRKREADLARVQRIGQVGGMDVDIANGMSSQETRNFRPVVGVDSRDEGCETEPAQTVSSESRPDCWFPRGTEPVFPPRSEPPLSMVF
ncbi:hypothetical protein HGP17_10390 [Rhizobium sp. P38BS-XIX]|uniref:hypothetical protein n=1 Tax=Rhizobium sp. P38BS-XIX TaxID=2726740 RepID=UPI0014564021|nr:hypothetical protein [Rhizobium sp. P38BS-XIX]NLR97241.1 hypothetical protein [Rhizobium sp. P38BS-XIX]